MQQYLPNPRPSKLVTSCYVRARHRAIITPSGKLRGVSNWKVLSLPICENHGPLEILFRIFLRVRLVKTHPVDHLVKRLGSFRRIVMIGDCSPTIAYKSPKLSVAAHTSLTS